MNVTGIIAEYNPFHNGHAYHIQKAKECTSADYIIVVMSGNFVQRGTPAILDKYIRTSMALQNGADVVLELPCAFACSSAEFFSEGAISILHNLGCVTSLCFGAETADITLLSSIADQLLEESPEFKQALHRYLSTGLTYPKARSQALLETTSALNRTNTTIYEELLQSPNNILGIEYIKSLKKRHSSIIPVSIPRISSSYHDTSLLQNGFSSATAIRTLLKTTHFEQNQLKQQVPSSVYSMLTEQQTLPLLFEDDFSLLLQFQLLNCTDYSTYFDVGRELSNRIKQKNLFHFSLSELTLLLKSKQYTLTRIQRALLHILLGITTEQMDCYKQQNFTSYARILGFKKSAAPLLKQMRTSSLIPIIQQPAKAATQLSPLTLELFRLDQKAYTLYEMVRSQKYSLPYEEEFRRKAIIL